MAVERPTTPEALVAEVYRLAEAGDTDGAGDAIFDTIDRWLIGGRFDLADDAIRLVDMARLPSTLRRSFLCITFAAKDRLPSRGAKWEEAFRLLKGEKGEDRARRIIGGLV